MDDKSLKVFLSHSHKDKEFVRQLDASLIAAGVDTFLDEKEILVGDSIPQKVYDGIDSSTHLMYIISENSVNSNWVKEEFSIGKMKEKESAGFKLLPILIDNVKIPLGIIHVRYADFREWRNPDSYRGAFLETLRSLKIEPKLFGRTDLIWYAKNSSKIRETYRILRTTVDILAGGRYDARDSSYLMSWKYVLDDYTFSALKRLFAEILSEADMHSNTRLSAIRKNAEEAYNFGIKLSYDKNNREKIQEFEQKVEIVTNMLDELRTEVEMILLAPFSNKESG